MVEEKKEDKALLLKERKKRISTLRGLVKTFGVCDLCGDEEKDSIQGDVLRISLVQRDGVDCDLQLCNLCEGVLIQRLVGGYLKRMECKASRRDKKMGFKGEIPLLEEEDEEGIKLGNDEDIPSLLERRQLLLKGTAEPPSWEA